MSVGLLAAAMTHPTVTSRSLSKQQRAFASKQASAFRCGLLHFVATALMGCSAFAAEDLAGRYTAEVLPLLKKYCNDCHNADEFKGDLDLARFTSFAEMKKDAAVWVGVIEQMNLGEMPPKKKPQPDAAEREKLLGWVNAALDEAAMATAGDPGPVVLRRLNNAEFDFTVRDLTGVESLEPAKEFPADSAAGEGFMNTGASLVMSPSLVSKYLDAGKEIAAHAVFLPDGMAFSPATSQRDWSEEKLSAIRAFYAKHTEAGGGQAVNLQGVKFDTNGGGVLPLAKYLLASIEEKSGSAEVAKKRGLSPKYLAMLWATLNDTKPSPLLDPLRARWRAAKPGDVPALVAEISSWQRALWKFSTIGHIGKRDGPKAWQEPVAPLAESREIKLKLTPKNQDVTLYLATTDACDGAENDAAIWKNPRLVMPGRADIPLRELRAVATGLAAQKQRVLSTAAQCLAAATEKGDVAELARKHSLDPAILTAWRELLGIGGSAKIENYITGKSEKSGDYWFIKGWTGADALSVVANSSDQEVRVPGVAKAHSVVVHPSPTRRAVVGWRAPIAGNFTITSTVQDAHTDCGNGVAWWLEVRRGSTRQTLASGNTDGAKERVLGPFENVAVQPGDLVSLIVGPRDGSHVCDFTALELTLKDGTREWSLGRDVSPDILAGNPHADSHGNANVWHFYSEPDKGGPTTSLPANLLLSKWQSATDGAEKQKLAAELQQLLVSNGAGLAKDSPDAALVAQLTSLRGPLFSSLIANFPKGTDSGAYGLPASQFDGSNLLVKGASVIEFSLPGDLAEGCEFVATAAVAGEGSVQMQATTTKPAAQALVPGTNSEGAKGKWSDGAQAVVSDSPVLVAENSEARRRMVAAFDEFRAMFPATLCYTKIVPVDEVVTLTLYYREDEQLRRLMLDDAEAAALDRLWSELHFVSHDAFKLVDAFEQLWQYATQDADPSAFTPMREPIQKKAAEFRETLVAAEPRHVAAVIDFAQRAWRRPTTESERSDMQALYKKLRAQELPHDAAIRMLLARVFVAPAFLYRMEKSAPGTAPAPVGDWELATRLSYFLWSSQPDDELRALAAAGRLREPEVLAAQARRMLKDARVRRLASEFGCAWLHIHDFASLDEKSEQHFPEFAALRGAMYEESIRTFADFFQSDRPVSSLLDADFTFVNEPLAKFYGIPAKGDWQRVDGVRKFGRGGILTMAAVLAKQSGASRTSPILRGNWLCETLLGEKLPRPPKGVPTLPETAPQGLTERQLTAQHSSDPNCAGCHIRIDPYGFAMEGYDAIGRLRQKDTAGLLIDTRTKLRTGEEFDGLDGLRSHLLDQRRSAVTMQFTKKLLGFALGRGVMLSDKPLLLAISAKDRTAAEVVELVVRSRQFREIRGTEHQN